MEKKLIQESVFKNSKKLIRYTDKTWNSNKEFLNQISLISKDYLVILDLYNKKNKHLVLFYFRNYYLYKWKQFKSHLKSVGQHLVLLFLRIKKSTLENQNI